MSSSRRRMKTNLSHVRDSFEKVNTGKEGIRGLIKLKQGGEKRIDLILVNHMGSGVLCRLHMGAARNIRTFGEFQGSESNYKISSYMPIIITMESRIGSISQQKEVGGRTNQKKNV
jgi:hypothetical protein